MTKITVFMWKQRSYLVSSLNTTQQLCYQI